MRRSNGPAMSKRKSMPLLCALVTISLAQHDFSGCDHHHRPITGLQLEPLGGGARALNGRGHLLPSSVNCDLGHDAAELAPLQRPLQLIAWAQCHGQPPLAHTSRISLAVPDNPCLFASRLNFYLLRSAETIVAYQLLTGKADLRHRPY